VAALGHRFEDAADPAIQIEQAIEEARRQHALLVEQAAAVIGNERQVAMRLARSMDGVEGLRASARDALRLAERARDDGDDAACASYEDTARSFAVALVTTEAEMRDLNVLHVNALAGAEAARRSVETNALELRERLAERTRLLSQLEQTKLQERMNAALGSIGSLAPSSDVPSLSRVRDKIEERYARATGMAELSSTTIEVAELNVRKATLEAEATRQLSALRMSLAAPSGEPD
jgi:phage shock protein A